MAVILMYHRIGKPPSVDPWDLVVGPEHFAGHLRVLRTSFDVLSLQDLCACLESGRVPARAVCVTFDDGYYDNLSLARPLLEEARVPATVFLATGFLGTSCFWWDRLARVFADAAVRDVSPDQAARPLGLEPPVTLERVWLLLRDLPAAERAGVLDRLEGALGTRGEAPADVRPMTEDETRRLVSPLLSIGAHTVDHAWLPACDEARVAQEIGDSLRRCAEIAGAPVRLFAYPYGAHDEAVVEVAARLGVECALTTTPVAVTAASPRLALPRVGVSNWTPAEFERRLTSVIVGLSS
jgi:peptidoglycan/xylan/chitin deacetylase (PgdA/CDA1 family)